MFGGYQQPQYSQDPYGASSGYDPYGQQGGGSMLQQGGGMLPQPDYTPSSGGFGYPGGYQGGFNPYGGNSSMFGNGFLNQWQGQYQDMMNQYQQPGMSSGEPGAYAPNYYADSDMGMSKFRENNPDYFADVEWSGGYPGAGAGSPTPYDYQASGYDYQASGDTGDTPFNPGSAPQAPNLGNLGARFDKGKVLTRKAEKKLNKKGYSDQQIHDARQAGGGAKGFRTALGGSTPPPAAPAAPAAQAYGNNFGQGFAKTGEFGEKGLQQIQDAGYQDVGDYLSNDPRGKQLAVQRARSGRQNNPNYKSQTTSGTYRR